jgi:GT2 family glycosyltransferase
LSGSSVRNPDIGVGAFASPSGYRTQVLDAASQESGPAVSVVIITRNRRRELLRSLRYLTSLPERPPVIVVDNDSSDGTSELVERAFPEVRTVRLAHNMGAAGRNVGVRLTTTPYVAFADDDSWWEAGSLARAARVLDTHHEIGVVAATVLVGREREPDATCRAMAASSLPDRPGLPGRSVLGFVACGAVVRVSAFLAVGGFDPLFGVGGEEKLLAVDLVNNGWAVNYVPDVVAVHEPSRQRNIAERRRIVVRNELWTAWLRRPWRSVFTVTCKALLSAVHRREDWRGFRDAVAGVPAVLARRARIEPTVERFLQLVE